MKKIIKRAVPAALALSLATTPVFAHAEEFQAEPGNPYNTETTERLLDDILEYDEIERLVDQYNTTLRNMRESYQDNKDSMKDIQKVKDQISDGSEKLFDTASSLSDMADSMKDMIGFDGVSPTAYGERVYKSTLLELQGEQLLLTADQLTEMTPEMMKIQMVDQVRAALISGAQSAMIGYEQIILQKENLNQTLELLEAVCKSTERQAAAGMATQSDVNTAKSNLESAKAGLQTIEANEVKLRQNLCTMLGWQYNADLKVSEIPSVDTGRITKMNLAADTETAKENNLTLKYNRLSEGTLTSGSVEMQNLRRTMKAEEAEIASSMVNLYNSVLQAQTACDTAQSTFELEKTKMDTAERKKSLGMIGNLEYLQQKVSYQSAEVSVRTADLSLLQAIETYDWAVKGNLSLTQ